jgi:hypothetical protein
MQGSRHLRTSALAFVALLGSALLSGCWLPAPHAASYFLHAPLVPVGGAAGGGAVEFWIDSRIHSSYFELNGMLPNTDYVAMVDGEAFALLSTDAAGHTSMNFPILSSTFDPRGRHVWIADPSGVEVLQVSPPNDPRYASAEIAPLSSFGPGGGAVRTTWIDGHESVSVELHGVDPNSYDVLANGAMQGTIDASGGFGSLFETPPGFDPSTAVIQVQIDGVDYYAGAGHANIEGIDWCVRGSVEQQFDAQTGGLGWASVLTKTSCERRFQILIEDVPVGDYEVVVGGVYEDVITVGQDEFGATVGSVLFTNSEDVGELLDFDPIGQSIEIEQNGVVYFSIAAYAPN